MPHTLETNLIFAGGTFLNITVAGFKGTGFVLPSACAKAGVDALTSSLASEWGR